MNAVYASVFKTPRPARVTVGVAALAVPTAHVEIMVTAQRQARRINRRRARPDYFSLSMTTSDVSAEKRRLDYTRQDND